LKTYAPAANVGSVLPAAGFQSEAPV